MEYLYITINCFWWWGSSSGNLKSVEYAFIAITPSSTLTWKVVPFKVPSMDQMDLLKIICIQQDHV